MGTKRASPYSSDQRQKRAVEQKRGQGIGRDYSAFIQVRRFDFSSHGRSHIWMDPFRPGVDHDLLSDVERFTLLQALASGAVLRAQFPLCTKGIEEEFAHLGSEAGTLSIAAALGIKHPMIKAGMPRVMTTDLLLKFPNGTYVAVYVKDRKKMSQKSQRREELELLERIYWKKRKAKFITATEDDVKVNSVIAWLDWAQTCRAPEITLDDATAFMQAQQFAQEILRTDERATIRDRIFSLGLTLEAGCAILKFCIWMQILKVDYHALPWPDLSRRWTLGKGNASQIPSLILIPEFVAAMRKKRRHV